MAAFIVFASKVAFICTRNTQCECELKIVEREGSSERSVKNEDGFSPGVLIEK